MIWRLCSMVAVMCKIILIPQTAVEKPSTLFSYQSRFTEPSLSLPPSQHLCVVYGLPSHPYHPSSRQRTRLLPAFLQFACFSHVGLTNLRSPFSCLSSSASLPLLTTTHPASPSTQLVEASLSLAFQCLFTTVYSYRPFFPFSFIQPCRILTTHPAIHREPCKNFLPLL